MNLELKNNLKKIRDRTTWVQKVKVDTMMIFKDIKYAIKNLTGPVLFLIGILVWIIIIFLWGWFAHLIVF